MGVGLRGVDPAVMMALCAVGWLGGGGGGAVYLVRSGRPVVGETVWGGGGVLGVAGGVSPEETTVSRGEAA